jgi:predicted HTH domain antitoxin
METSQIVIDVPDTIAVSVGLSELEKEVKCHLAIKCYLDNKITIGQAARLAGMKRMEFEIYLADNGFPTSLYDMDDLQSDLAKMNNFSVPAR